jgi:hypothetical protein
MATKQGSFSGYVLLPTSTLASLTLQHLLSELDPSIAVQNDARAPVTVTGYTEWVGSWCHRRLSLGWDWGVVQGLVVVLNPTEIRTNIRLLSADARIEDPGLARIHLLDWIESAQWRPVIDALIRNAAGK